ncbi:hypothetical protein [Demetria terragena]|uniref:hypothetical protein n=1 Tax=Demetria terragena TaxID=63959 RepID=UPI0003750C50|nr:hypothetical protein [Demetria terragena]
MDLHTRAEVSAPLLSHNLTRSLRVPGTVLDAALVALAAEDVLDDELVEEDESSLELEGVSAEALAVADGAADVFWVTVGASLPQAVSVVRASTLIATAARVDTAARIRWVMASP